MMQQLIECVPNFSEGRDMAIIKQITDAIEAVDGVHLLDTIARQCLSCHRLGGQQHEAHHRQRDNHRA